MWKPMTNQIVNAFRRGIPHPLNWFIGLQSYYEYTGKFVYYGHRESMFQFEKYQQVIRQDTCDTPEFIKRYVCPFYGINDTTKLRFFDVSSQDTVDLNYCQPAIDLTTSRMYTVPLLVVEDIALEEKSNVHTSTSQRLRMIH